MSNLGVAVCQTGRRVKLSELTVLMCSQFGSIDFGSIVRISSESKVNQKYVERIRDSICGSCIANTHQV